jgi:hypothetical protein
MLLSTSLITRDFGEVPLYECCCGKSFGVNDHGINKLDAFEHYHDLG